jgi:hypothetical protein
VDGPKTHKSVIRVYMYRQTQLLYLMVFLLALGTYTHILVSTTQRIYANVKNINQYSAELHKPGSNGSLNSFLWDFWRQREKNMKNRGEDRFLAAKMEDYKGEQL